MGAIATIVATTVTVSERTRRRLAGYKHGGMTFDDVLNALMDACPVREFTAAQLAEHERLLASPDTEWISAREAAARIGITNKRGTKRPERRGVRGSGGRVRAQGAAKGAAVGARGVRRRS